ncbi:conserved hypothetical protein [Leishmania braziliensis MHOM/BR/75/M2904]|uniref:Uncharacterized protein n=2 Tax=Leishmania braziliensis TaxID=5660 RepID=A4HIM7_LEIBR|nr:conserved hypothetical protein [Leishmania braziliensis MHOM/BR/75/M2904]KAI5689868.1 hypothetical protein MNV84_06045 [Leishmania braziliensis]CAJ2477368.1 unnamed protein product [Leishmania braziliensis]CAJ2477879.1 unnamed protein product [Leishmania braziliensis]CAM40440.1 conserved hypothetical protein [Leishmania braziliensis MHOM/BR/75/M2904]SYZ68114.1 hypothetical_protein [Leishmania braziliensis MHOM/BR/75/M2904]
MLISANSLVRWSLAAVGISGAGLSGAYVYNTHFHQHPVRNDKIVQLAAIALSGEVVDKSLHDPEVLSQLRAFGLQVLTHPTVVAHLKKFFIHELTDDTPTRAALRSFVVREIIQDSWVKEELIGVAEDLVDSVKDNPDLFPDRILTWLGVGALEGLRTEEFWWALRQHTKTAGWIAFIGPPPFDMVFEAQF